MTIKKLTVIAVAGAALLAGAIGISMSLTDPHEMEMQVSETSADQEESGAKTLGDMENIPLYYDETEKLLLPLRNVMEGLGGSVKWNTETRKTEVTYRGRTLELAAGEEQAVLNGYEVTLPAAAEIINGCLYADEMLISAYYTGDVDFNAETRQVTLQAKDSTEPVMAVNRITGEKDGLTYEVEVPVIVGLNDDKYEKNLNKSLQQELQASIDEFLQTEKKNDGALRLKANAGMCTKDFLSIYWEGMQDGVFVKRAENVDLLGQKTVTLADMLNESALKAVKASAAAGWTEDDFLLTAGGNLALFANGEEGVHAWGADFEKPEWKAAYQGLFPQK